MASFYNNKISTTYVSIIKSLDNAALTASLKELSDGSGNATGLFMNTGGDFKVTNILEWGTLKDTGENISITKFVDEADGIANNDNDTSIPTTAAIVDYVAARITLEDLDFSGTTGTGSVDLDSQVFAIVGTTNEIETSAGSQQLQIGLPDNVTISGNLQVNGLLKGNNNIVVKDTSDRTMAAFYGGGKVELYFNDSKKLESTSDGVTITGGLTATGSSVFTSASFSGTITGNVTGDLTGNVTATSVLANGVTATTQSSSDNSTKVATTAYVDAQAALSDTLSEVLAIGNTTGGTSVSVSSGDNINFSDSSMAIFGTGSDLKIYHDGSTSYIKDVGTGNLELQGSAIILKDTSSNTLGTFYSGGKSELYFNNSKKLETTSDGATVTGGLTATGGSVFTGATFSSDVDWTDNAKARFGTGNDLEIYHDASNSYIVNSGVGNLNINASNLALNNGGGTKTYLLGTSGGSVQLRYNDNTKIETTNIGVTITGVATADGLDMGDDEKIRLGDSQDLEIYHDGSHSYIQDVGTGNLIIEGSADLILKATGSNNLIVCNANADVQLMHNGTEKLKTTTGGVSVTGVTDTDGITSSAEIDVDLASEGKYFEGGSGSTRRLSITSGTNTSAHALHTFNIASTNGKYKFDIDGTEEFSVDASNASLGGNLTVAGNLIVNGTTTTINTSTIAVEDSMIEMAKDNAANSLDIGTYGKYNDGSARYLGLFSDASDSNKFKLFKNLTVQPTTTVDTSDASFALADLVAGNVETGNMTISGQEIDVSSGDLTLDVAGDIVLSADGGDVNLADGATFMGRLGLENGDLNIASTQQDYDIRLKGNDGGSVITALHLDMSEGGAATFAGNVGIGGTPSAALEVSTANPRVKVTATTGTNPSYLNINNTGGSTYVGMESSVAGSEFTGTTAYASVFGSSGARDTQFLTSGTVRMTLDSSGDATFAGKVIASSSSTGDYIRMYGGSGTGKWDIYGSGADLRFSDNDGAGYIRFDRSVGIGLSPTKELQVSGEALFGNGTDGLLLSYSGTNSSGIIDTGHSSTALEFRVGNTQELLINGSSATFAGTININSNKTLNLRNVDNTNGFQIYNAGATGSSNANLIFLSGSVGERMRLDSSGNLLVSKTSANNATVGNQFMTDGSANTTVNGDTVSRLNRLTSDGEIIRFQKDTATVGTIGTQNWGIGTGSPIVPLHIVGTAVNNPSNGTGGYEVMQVFDNTSTNTGVGGGIGFGGKFNSSGNDTVFSEIRGIKENSIDSNYAGALTFSTRINGANITERMRIDSSGNVGIGVTPEELLHLKSNNPKVYLEDGNAGTNEKVYSIYPAGSQYVLQTLADDYGAGQQIYVVDRSGTTVDEQKFYIDNTAALTLGSSQSATFAGDVLAPRYNIDTTSMSVISESNRMKFTNAIANDAGGFDFYTRNTSSTYINALQILGTGNATFAGNVKIGTATTITPATQADDLVIDKGATESGITIVSTSAGGIRFGDAASASMGSIEYNHTSDYMRFGTNASERMRITSGGVVQCGLSTANAQSTAKLSSRVNGSAIEFGHTNNSDKYFGTLGSYGSNGSPFISFSCWNELSANTWTTKSTVGNIINGDLSGNLCFQQVTSTDSTGQTPTERMRITSGGNILFGTDSISNITSSYIGSGFGSESNNRMTLFQGTTSTAAMTLQAFYNPNGQVGRIATDGSATGYFTSSDYRLKENVVEMNGALDRVSQLKPSRFNFKADADKVVDGFLAHEVQDIVPEAITGEKDAMQDEEYEITPAKYKTVVHPAEDAVYETIEHPAIEEELDDEGNVIVEGQEAYTEEKLITEAKEEWSEEVLESEAVMGTRQIPDYQAIDQSKLVPLLVGAIQELKAEIDELKNKCNCN